MVGALSSVGCRELELCISPSVFGGLDSVTRLGLEVSVTGSIVVVEECWLVITVLPLCFSSCECAVIVVTFDWVGLLTCAWVGLLTCAWV